MALNFEPIALEKQMDYVEHLQRCQQKASDYSFINLWGWAEEYRLSWAWKHDLVWIRQAFPHTCLWAPVGNWDAADWPACMHDLGTQQTPMIRVPQKLSQTLESRLQGRITIEEARGHWDYLYSVQELIELKGNRFHKKKNLLKQFTKKYDYRYVTLQPELIHKVIELQEDWCNWRDCESSETLIAENHAIERVLKAWPKLIGISGGAIFVGEEMIAYTVADRLTDDTLVIHFEKGCTGYKGVYQAINQMFLEHVYPGVLLVNREQDIDDPGLRKAKLSYNPVDFLRKFTVSLKN